jgi:hypothetical protein
LTEAILAHGGEAESSRGQAAVLPESDFAAMLAFLNNPILFDIEEDEVVVFRQRTRHHSRQ